MLSTYSSVQRAAVPVFNLCKNHVYYTSHCNVIKSQQSLVMFCPSKHELTRTFYSTVYKPVWSSCYWNTAHVDKNIRQSLIFCNSRRYQLNCSTLKINHDLSKPKFVNNNGQMDTVCQKYCNAKTKQPRKVCVTIKKLTSDISYMANVGETGCKLTLLKSWITLHKRKCSISPLGDHVRRCYHVGNIFTNSALLNRKSRQHIKLHSFFHTSTRSSCQQTQACIRKQPPWRIMFFGTDKIATHTIEALYYDMINSGSLVESLDVVTGKAGKDQREVAVFAEKKNLKIHDWPLAIEREKYDVGVLVSFGHLIPEDVIHMFPYGILNMHPSLLPRWRGASPVVHTILHNDGVTGVSVMDIRPKHFDIGPVLLQRTCKIPYRCTTVQLAEILGRYGASAMMDCLKDLPTLESLEHEQKNAGVTYAHKIKYKNSNIDWENNTAEQIDCQFRAIAELIPLRTELNGHVVKLLNVVDPSLFKDIDSNDVNGYNGEITEAEPGTVGYHKPSKCIVVKCKRGLIGFENIVLKKTLSASDFNNGYINRNKLTKFVSQDNDLSKYINVKKISLKAKG